MQLAREPDSILFVRVDEPAAHPAKRLFRALALRHIPARIQRRSVLDRHLFDVNEKISPSAGLRSRVALDVADLSAGGKLPAIEQVVAEQPADPSHCVHFVRGVLEDDVHIGAHELEHAFVVGEEHRV